MTRQQILLQMGFVSYDDYLRSNLWKRIRSACLGKSPICSACIAKPKRWWKPATQVHHQSYDERTMTGEDLSKLVPLCGACHKKVEFDPGGSKRTFKHAVLTCNILLALAKERQRS